MINLSRKQLKFLKAEFGINKEQLGKLSKEEWHHIREESIWISADELMDDEGHAVDFVTERCQVAESIIDITYDELKG